MKRNISRRHFLQTNITAALAASAFPSIVPASARGANGSIAPGDRMTLGVIGAGPQGRTVLGGFLARPEVRVVAVCDAKKDQLELGRKQINDKYQESGCAVYEDFRELLARKDIDAVLIATPDHWHVPVAVAAARAGKDMYLEKPMGLTIAEDQILRRTIRENKRVFQFGTQQRSDRQFLRACELVRNGRIGKLKQINVWCSASRPGGSTTPAPVPAGLNYDLWLGPAPATPYTPDKCSDNNKTWWFNYDYALGFIAGWGVHPLDIALWGHPAMMNGAMEISGSAVIPSTGACNTAVAWEVNFTFADGVRLNFRGTRNQFADTLPMNDLTAFQQKYTKIADHGTAFEGTDGWILVDRTGLRSSPEEFEPLGAGDTQLIRSSNHVRNFVDAVKSRAATICPIDESVQADTLCHLSDIATRANRKLKWDPRGERFIDDAEANRKLQLRPMRSPWQLT